MIFDLDHVSGSFLVDGCLPKIIKRLPVSFLALLIVDHQSESFAENFFHNSQAKNEFKLQMSSIACFVLSQGKKLENFDINYS